MDHQVTKWQKEGVPNDKPSFPNGTHSFLSGKKHLNDFAFEDYKKFKMEQGHRVHGWFLMGKPALSINDPELLKQIQVKDFNHFVDRMEVNMAKSFLKGGELDRVRKGGEKEGRRIDPLKGKGSGYSSYLSVPSECSVKLK